MSSTLAMDNAAAAGPVSAQDQSSTASIASSRKAAYAANSSQGIMRLPVEIFGVVVLELPARDLATLRQTAKQCNERTKRAFVEAHFSSHCKLGLYDIQRMQDAIDLAPELARIVTRISLDIPANMPTDINTRRQFVSLLIGFFTALRARPISREIAITGVGMATAAGGQAQAATECDLMWPLSDVASALANTGLHQHVSKVEINTSMWSFPAHKLLGSVTHTLLRAVFQPLRQLGISAWTSPCANSAVTFVNLLVGMPNLQALDLTDGHQYAAGAGHPWRLWEALFQATFVQLQDLRLVNFGMDLESLVAFCGRQQALRKLSLLNADLCQAANLDVEGMDPMLTVRENVEHLTGLASVETDQATEMRGLFPDESDDDSDGSEESEKSEESDQ